MSKNKKSKVKVNDVVMHIDDKKLFLIEDVVSYPRKGNLYTMKEISSDDQITYKRYYESKLMDKCVKTKNTKAAKVLYGKGK